MRAFSIRLLMLFVCASVGLNLGEAQTAKKPTSTQTKALPAAPAIDLKAQPTLYTVGYAHLDTEWRWEYPQSINEYLSKTLRNNFALADKYPHYIFNFTGANRYRLMKEYYPADYAKLKQYVAAGRWFPAGSSMEEGDVNSPNAESIFRQILYGNNFFRREFGTASHEYMLPDCFGFPASLPSILHHAGIKGFSTQKLSANWQPAPHVGGPDSPEKTPEGIPFNVGIWEGTDGSTIIAALNPLSYGSQVTYDLSKTPPPPPSPDPNLTAQQNSNRTRPQEDWVKRIQINGGLTGIKADYHYVGTGDIGGAPNEYSVKLMEAIVTKSKTALPGPPPSPRDWEAEQEPSATQSAPVQVGDGPIHVVWSKADQMFDDILKCCNTDRMPRYKGDLELINHSAGSITSEAYQKRWMRKNEVLADAAEKASLAATWLGGRPYPMERLNAAWTLVMGGQFHDLLPGTATPKAFEFAWNDDIIAMNQFAGVLKSATAAVASAMDTETQGTPIVVYNPLNVQREDVVEAAINFPNGVPKSVRVTGPGGKEVPAQVSGEKDGAARVLFVAKTPSVGYAVFDVQPADASASGSELKVSESSLENARYAVKLDQNGDVSSIFDKKVNKELLSAPIRLAISTDNPEHWPAWNMDFEDEQRAPKAYVSGSPKITVVENGPARVAVQIDRDTEGSNFVQTVRLSAGDAGNRVEFANKIDWKTKGVNLKATFPLSAGNKMATYNWDVGTIQRPNEEERQFEVASHQWIDLTDQSGSFGATVLTDCKNASDKPNDNTLRLTLIRTPGTRGGYPDQGTQDLGHHDILFGLAGHTGDWREGQTDWQAYRLNDPLVAFESSKHSGSLGKQFSFARVSNSRVRVLALKKAEQGDEIVVRAVEIDGKPASNVHFAFASPVLTAREINAQEQPLGSATVQGGELVTSFGAYQPRSFAVKLGASAKRVSAPQFAAVTLPYDVSVASIEDKPASGCFDCSFDRPTAPQGKALPAEMMPSKIDYAGVTFTLVPAAAGQADAVTTNGQTINLPAGKFNRVYLLAAAANGDHKATFKIGDKSLDLNVQDWTGFVGQWDDRIWKATEESSSPRQGAAPLPNRPRVFVNPYGEMVGIRPGFIKRADIAWFSDHRHDDAARNEAYAYSYLFAYGVDVPEGVKTLTLPRNHNIRILAATAANENAQAWPAQLLYDELNPEPSQAEQ
ncbi:MAG TPA: glycoside hydrolase family 38 C-terminal domain-containing protein [Terriglobales bacterium]|nr:glycoside hydrolase family 38 C-terminal domain-containing protein [Terriglobales bacterium]